MPGAVVQGADGAPTTSGFGGVVGWSGLPAAMCLIRRVAADVRRLLSDGCGRVGSDRLGFGLRRCDDGFDRCMDGCNGSASAEWGERCILKLLLESFDFLVGLAVDLVEAAAGVPDQLCGLLDGVREVAIEVRLVDYRLAGAVAAFAHGVDHAPGIGATEGVGGATDRRGRRVQIKALLIQCARGVRPGLW